MSRIQWKKSLIRPRTKKITTWVIKNYQLAPTNSEINKMLGLSDKDFKAAMIKMLQQATKIFLK